MTPRALAAPFAALALVLLAGCASASGGGDIDLSPVDAPASVESESPDVEPAAPVAEAPSPAQPAAASYEVGDPFDESCSVAWPSAPAVTATDIQITAQCSGVPGTYPLVLVVYPDPSLPITPSTGSFRVVGEVYGTATSQAGMPYLIVLASEVRL